MLLRSRSVFVGKYTDYKNMLDMSNIKLAAM